MARVNRYLIGVYAFVISIWWDGGEKDHLLKKKGFILFVMKIPHMEKYFFIIIHNIPTL